MPGFRPVQSAYQPAPVGLKYVDHCVGNVELGKMNVWVKFYARRDGLPQPASRSTTRTSRPNTRSLMSKVMANGNDRIKFPINEPAAGKKKSQIDEYLEFYQGPGVQHIALATDDIIATVTALRDRGVEFLTVPTTYYDELQDRVGQDRRADRRRSQRLGHPGGPRRRRLPAPDLHPSRSRTGRRVFYEIIQRKGAKSFGKGNFKALFEAIEREQAAAGKSLRVGTSQESV